MLQFAWSDLSGVALIRIRLACDRYARGWLLNRLAAARDHRGSATVEIGPPGRCKNHDAGACMLFFSLLVFIPHNSAMRDVVRRTENLLTRCPTHSKRRGGLITMPIQYPARQCCRPAKHPALLLAEGQPSCWSDFSRRPGQNYRSDNNKCSSSRGSVKLV
jgi:hypothetical protein